MEGRTSTAPAAATLEARWRGGDSGKPAPRQHGPDTGHGSQGRDQLCPRGRSKAVGRHRDHPRQGQNRGAPSRPSGERDLHRQGPCTHALGRPSRVHGGGRAGRLHLCASLRSTPGNQRQPDRAAGVCAVPQRWRGSRGEPGHRACRKAGAGAVGRSHASQRRRLGNRTSRAINPYVIGNSVFGSLNLRCST